MKLGMITLAAIATATMGASTAQAAAQKSMANGFGVSGIGNAIDGCIDAFASVDASNGITKEGGPPIVTGRISMSLVVVDDCNSSDIVRAAANQDMANINLSVDNRLSMAHLVTTVDLVDPDTNAITPASINLSWTATGPATPSRVRSRSFIDGTMEIDDFTGSTRVANVAGSITYGQVKYVLSWHDSYISQNKGSVLIVGH